MMTPEIYAIWSEQWKLERPGQEPPTLEQTNWLMEAFDFTVQDLCGDVGLDI